MILPKLDGSLVYPAANRWVTRGGVTDTSRRAEALAEGIGEPLRELLRVLREDRDGSPCTPCFEYIGPENQIVLRYERSRLVLLAVRRIEDGRYWPSGRILDLWKETQGNDGDERLEVARPIAGLASGVPANGKGYAEALAREIGAWDGKTHKGVVVVFEGSGHRIKIKSREYIALHRARDNYSSESRVLQVWSDDNQRTLLAQLGPERAARLQAYYDALEERIAETARTVRKEAVEVWNAAGGNRKGAVAAWIARTTDRTRTRPLGFNAFDAIEKDADLEARVAANIRARIAKTCRRSSLIESRLRPILGKDGPVWNPPDGNRE